MTKCIPGGKAIQLHAPVVFNIMRSSQPIVVKDITKTMMTSNIGLLNEFRPQMEFEPKCVITVNFNNNPTSDFMNSISSICVDRFLMVTGALRNGIVVVFLENKKDAVLIKMFID